MDPSKTGPVKRTRFIEAMRNVAPAVKVVTTEGPAERHGATVSAFSSVSADPPTVLVCLFAGSRIAQAVAQNRRFCVNVLPEFGQEIADRFAGHHDGWIADRFHGIGFRTGTGFGPRIEGATVFECNVQRIVRSGTRQIMLGLVQNAGAGENAPLAYRDGQYQRLTRNEAITLHNRH